MSSANNAYMPGYGQVKHHKWRTAENSASYMLPTLEQKAKENPRLTLLDVGAGSGTISASFAKYMPEGHITASDLSDDILTQAKEYAHSKNVSNMSFQQSSVFDLVETFGQDKFDIVHASMVLTHLSRPIEALAQMLQVVKPGGVVAVRESDLRMVCFYPELEGIHAFQRTLLATHKISGGSVNAGPQLVSWAMKAGAKRENITASMGTWCYSSPEDRQAIGGSFAERTRNGNMRKVALEHGLASEADIDKMADAWDEWVATEDANYGSMHGEVLIRK